MNEQLKELTLNNFKEIINNLKGNDLKDILRGGDNVWTIHDWIGDALDEACEELNLDIDEIQETQQWLEGLYDDECYEYIDELRGEWNECKRH